MQVQAVSPTVDVFEHGNIPVSGGHRLIIRVGSDKVISKSPAFIYFVFQTGALARLQLQPLKHRCVFDFPAFGRNIQTTRHIRVVVDFCPLEKSPRPLNRLQQDRFRFNTAHASIEQADGLSWS
jgi:hypothetical protein